MLKKEFFIIYALTVIVGCSGKVATVGDVFITESDIYQRTKVSDVYYPGSGKHYVALSQLIEGYLSLAVLESMGHKVNDAALEAETERIDENTKAPDVLRKIKDNYGNDRKAYIRTFVLPVYAQRTLYDLYLNGKEIHKESHQKAIEFLNEALASPGLSKEIAAKMGLESTTLRVSLKDGISPYNQIGSPKEVNAGFEEAKRLIDVLAKVKAGELYPDIIEWSDGYQVIKLIKKEGNAFVVKSVAVPKRDYNEWFWEKASKIPVTIYDEALKDELMKEVSWARNLRQKK